MRRLKAYLRRKLIECQPCYARYTSAKYFVQSLYALRFSLVDMRQVWRHMYWGHEQSMAAGQLQAKLLFYYHKIEKGLCMPGRKRLFALDVVPRVIGLLETWESQGNSRQDPIYLGAISSLRAYGELIRESGLDPSRQILPVVDLFLASRQPSPAEQVTPIAISDQQVEALVDYPQFRALCETRRSFRDFRDQPVPELLLRQAVELAQLSPSACNRQPCRAYVVTAPELKQRLLSCQNGNAGFGHLAPVVLAISADMTHFFGATERHQPYVDGGLFSMSMLYALQVQGLVSCCLNWCVTPEVDARAHKLLGLPDSERIIMLMLAGYPPEQTLVPKSHRKMLDRILFFR